MTILLFCIAFSSFSQNTYYVSNSGTDDPSNGSQSSPWETIQYAVDQVNANDTIVVEAGTYQEIITFGPEDSGTSGNPVTLQANGSVLIDGSTFTPSGRIGLITINGASNISIDGFEIANFQTPNPVFEDNNTPIGILVEGTCSNISIQNNTIHDIKNLSSCSDDDGCGTGANGIAIYGSTSTGISNIELLNNEVYQCQTASSEVFTINGNVNGFKVLNNNVHDNNNIGYDFIGYESDTCPSCTTAQNRARNGLVKGNTAQNNSIFGSPSASPPVPSNPWYASSVAADEGSAGGFYVDGGQNIIFDGNISTGNDLGFEFAGENINSASEDILMINNYVFNNKENGVIIGGFSTTENDPQGGGGDAIRIYIYNNSFYQNKGWGSEIVFQSRVKDSRISNNIFYGESTAGESHEDFDSSSNTNNTWGNNIWFGTSTAGSVSLPGIVIAQNPNYTNPSVGNLDLQSTSTAAIDTGNLESTITSWLDPFWDSIFPPNGTIIAQGSNDIKGNDRVFNTAIDFGAHELGSSLSLSNSSVLNGLSIFPNPAVDFIKVSGPSSFNYAIISLSGTLLLSGHTDKEIDISSLANGIYILQLSNRASNQTTSKKFIISK